ncbi:P-loop containing nucleoside triphosphate hydrolase protein [Serendipita vermifera]|nr:P-loop containing nucleoside triphosphate hydrolase protein [Serendipita vermifera]
MSEIYWTNIMLIGDPGVGKRSIHRRYIDNQPPSPNPRGLQYTFKKSCFPLGSSPILPNGWNKSSQKLVETNIRFYMISNLPKFRPLIYNMVLEFKRSAVVAICYDCSKPETLYNAIYKWYPIVLHYAPAIPIFLLGCKSDQKAGLYQVPVTTEEAKKAARQIEAIDVLECSAEEGDSVYSVCDTVAWYGYYSHLWRINPG